MDLTKYDLADFKSGLEQLKINLSEKQLEQFLQYYELLIEWNSFMNLTAITDFSEVCTKHFLDSLSLIRAVDCKKELKVIDVGTGAGFPGIPLKIAFPNLNVTLLDSLDKRVKFLNEAISALGLENINAVHGRAEDFARQDAYREQFDICVSRAVANLSVLSEYCIPFVANEGFFISYKSEKIADELFSADKAINLLGGKLTRQIVFTLPNSDICRNLLVIEKVKSTSKKYPRRAGLPAKEPL